jgi:putative ABC transport system permease protein
MNRPDFSHSSGAVTGGWQFYGESRIPIQYDLNTPAGRHHLHLDDLPAESRFLQLPKHTEDEASCLNLNKVETPSVIGMAPEEMKTFGIALAERNDLVPVAVDEEALLWSMMKQVGDTLNYHATDGRQVRAVIAGSYPTGIFHGNAVMPLSAFRQLWPDETGSRILLFSLQSPSQGPVRGSSATPPIAQALSDYGVTIIPTSERLRQFFEVTDTYLSIFLSLGGLGLLLGLVSLLIVIRKNLAARRSEIQLYHTLGFPSEAVAGMLRREQLVVPLLAVVAGMAGSYAVSFLIPLTAYLFTPTAIVLLLLMLALTWIIIHISINPKTIKQCATY